MIKIFKVVCNNQLLCVSPTYRGAEQYIKKIKKKDKLFNEIHDYKIIQEELDLK